MSKIIMLTAFWLCITQEPPQSNLGHNCVLVQFHFRQYLELIFYSLFIFFFFWQITFRSVILLLFCLLDGNNCYRWLKIVRNFPKLMHVQIFHSHCIALHFSCSNLSYKCADFNNMIWKYVRTPLLPKKKKKNV